MKRLLKVLISSVLITMVLTSCTSNSATNVPSQGTLKVGDYLQMGRYYDEPILWRCVDIDENGPLMLSDKILCIKSFDAKWVHTYLDGSLQKDFEQNFRTNYGSNFWETSNIRSWLNSVASAGKVKWLDHCAPSKDNLLGGLNAYDSEKGFISNDNFSLREKKFILLTTQKSILNSVDLKLKDGGTESFMADVNADISQLHNFENAYYQNVSDKLFLLDIKQLNKVYQNRSILGSDYFIGKPTKEAVKHSQYKGEGDYKIIDSEACNYWIRTPLTYVETDYTMTMDKHGFVLNSSVNNTGLGVRPAYYINITSGKFNSGLGTLSDPFII